MQRNGHTVARTRHRDLRDGRFTMTPEGDLVTLNGYPVLDAGGTAIRLAPFRGPPAASGPQR